GAHQLAEYGVGLFGVLNMYLHQYPFFRIHSGLIQLVGVHFAKTLVALLFYKTGLAVTLVFRIDFRAVSLALGYRFVQHLFQFGLVIYIYATLTAGLYEFEQRRF